MTTGERMIEGLRRQVESGNRSGTYTQAAAFYNATANHPLRMADAVVALLGPADRTDMETWGIMATEWKSAVAMAVIDSLEVVR